MRIDLVVDLVQNGLMKTYNVHAAKTHFSEILALVSTGEEVVVAKAGRPVAIISAYRSPTRPRQPGLFRNQVTMTDAFLEPMDLEFQSYFE